MSIPSNNCDNIDILTTKVWKIQKGKKNFYAFWRGISKKGGGRQKSQKRRGDNKEGDQDILKTLEGGRSYLGGHYTS